MEDQLSAYYICHIYPYSLYPSEIFSVCIALASFQLLVGTPFGLSPFEPLLFSWPALVLEF